MWLRISWRTTCEGVWSSRAHSSSKTAFLRGSIKIVSRAVRCSGVMSGLRFASVAHLMLIPLTYDAQGPPGLASVLLQTSGGRIIERGDGCDAGGPAAVAGDRRRRPVAAAQPAPVRAVAVSARRRGRLRPRRCQPRGACRAGAVARSAAGPAGPALPPATGAAGALLPVPARRRRRRRVAVRGGLFPQ